MFIMSKMENSILLILTDKIIENLSMPIKNKKLFEDISYSTVKFNERGKNIILLYYSIVMIINV